MNETVYNVILALADKYAQELHDNVDLRINEMESDDNAHYLIYRVLGIKPEEGKMIDQYQNKGRFLYKCAGAFLEASAIACIKNKHPYAEKVKIPNTYGSRPKTFEIDCLVGMDAHEIKWRDATTDGDHITKEHTRVKAIKQQGFTPIRVMFYYPQRSQAVKIQEALEAMYIGLGGKYYYGDAAWSYIAKYTGIDLLEILQKIADSKA